MINIRVSGARKSTDVFYQIMNDLVENKILSAELKDKEYENLDGTIRRYFNVGFMKPAEKEQVSGFFCVSARISAKDINDVVKVINVFTNIAKVYHMGKTNGLDIRKRKGMHNTMVCIMSEAEAAKRITMNTMSENLKQL